MDNGKIGVAIELASKAHKNQIRKTSEIPYISHPFAVGMILCGVGCSDDLVAAGILHDTVEDTPVTLEDIRREFGDRVASIVEGCSEPDKSLSWEARKEHTLESLKTASLDVRLVTCADKLHNVKTIAAAHGRLGENVWERFRRGREKQAWYYHGLVQTLQADIDDDRYQALYQEFRREVEALFGMTEGPLRG
jgi:(p)ppGpp synthase/HD superfamily hydrolase